MSDKNSDNKLKSPMIPQALNMLTGQVFMLFISLLLVSLLSIPFKGDTVMIITSAISTIFFIIISYSTTWRVAERDTNLVNYNHIVRDDLKGLYIGLLATIPGFILAVIATLKGYGVDLPDFFIPVYKIYFGYIVGLVNIFDKNYPFVYLLPNLIMPIAGYFGYIFGFKRIRISDKIIYVQKKKPNSRLKR